MRCLKFVVRREAFVVLKDIYDFVYGFISQQATALDQESKFWEILFRILRNAYEDFEHIVLTLKLSHMYEDGSNFQYLLKAIKEADLKVDEFEELRELAIDLLLNNARTNLINNVRLLCEFGKPMRLSSEDDGNMKTLDVFGKNVRMKAVFEQIRSNDYDEIRFIGMDVFHNDADMIVYCKNVFLMANRVKMHVNVTWDVSGKNGEKLTKPKADQDSQGVGFDGVDGNSGESSENVVIITDKIENESKWKIIGNGGDGTKGQEGGDGKKGEDGEFFNYTQVMGYANSIEMMNDYQAAQFGVANQPRDVRLKGTITSGKASWLSKRTLGKLTKWY